MYFSFSIYSENTEVVNIELRINDKKHNNNYNDRFNRTFSIKSGNNNISIPLEDIAKAPESRFMDMQNMYLIVLFSAQPENEFTLYFDNFKLE